MPTVWSDTFLLMGLGMGTVFVFLVLLIAAVTIMSKVIQQLSPEVVEVDTTTENTDVDIAVVAAAAYQLHHNSQTK